MSSMEYDQFKSRLSKYQKQYDPDLCTLQRESFAIDLRKSKRHSKHQKFRINQVIPKCGNIPDELLKKFQIFCPQNLKESINTFKGLLKIRKDLLETLKCLNYFLERLSECDECEVLIKDLIEIFGTDPQYNTICFDCIMQCSYLVEGFVLDEEDIEVLFNKTEGVTNRMKMILAYNLLVGNKLEHYEINFIVQYIFESNIEERDTPFILEILGLIASNVDIDLLPGLNWLSVYGVNNIYTRVTSFNLISAILKRKKCIPYKLNLLKNQVDKVLLNLIVNNEYDIIKGLKILNKMFVKYLEDFNKFKTDEVIVLSSLISHPNHQIKRLVLIILKKHLNKDQIIELITLSLVKNVVPDLISHNPDIQVKALRFANYLLYNFGFTLKYFIDSHVLSTLSQFVASSPKSQKYFYLLCDTFIYLNPDLVTELEQNSLFEIIDSYDSWPDEDSKKICDNLLLLRPSDNYIDVGPVKTFIFS